MDRIYEMFHTHIECRFGNVAYITEFNIRGELRKGRIIIGPTYKLIIVSYRPIIIERIKVVHKICHAKMAISPVPVKITLKKDFLTKVK